MRILLITLFIIILAQTQANLRITEIQNVEKKELITSLLSGDEYSTQDFSLRIHKKENPYGSADNDSGEITHSYFFVISDNDDYPKRSLFEVGEFYGPEIKSVRKKEDVIEVDIEFYSNLKKTMKTVFVRQHKLSF